MSRILIAGWPRVGKTTLARELSQKNGTSVLRHTDDVLGLGWSQSSLAVSAWFEEDGAFIIEGVAIPRALRKFVDRSAGLPAELLYWSSMPREILTAGQTSMGKGCDTVWAEVRGELVRRGMRIEAF